MYSQYVDYLCIVCIYSAGLWAGRWHIVSLNLLTVFRANFQNFLELSTLCLASLHIPAPAALPAPRALNSSFSEDITATTALSMATPAIELDSTVGAVNFIVDFDHTPLLPASSPPPPLTSSPSSATAGETTWDPEVFTIINVIFHFWWLSCNLFFGSFSPCRRLSYIQLSLSLSGCLVMNSLSLSTSTVSDTWLTFRWFGLQPHWERGGHWEWVFQVELG